MLDTPDLVVGRSAGGAVSEAGVSHAFDDDQSIGIAIAMAHFLISLTA